MTVQDFLAELGGQTAVADTLGVPLSTVSAWARFNAIPHWRMPAVAALALKQSKPVPADFGPRVYPPKRERAA